MKVNNKDKMSCEHASKSRSYYSFHYFRPMFVESSNIIDDPKQILESKIHDVESLLLEADVSFRDVEGIGKYKKKLKTEMKFLTAVSCLYQLMISLNEYEVISSMFYSNFLHL